MYRIAAAQKLILDFSVDRKIMAGDRSDRRNIAPVQESSPLSDVEGGRITGSLRDVHNVPERLMIECSSIDSGSRQVFIRLKQLANVIELGWNL